MDAYLKEYSYIRILLFVDFDWKTNTQVKLCEKCTYHDECVSER